LVPTPAHAQHRALHRLRARGVTIETATDQRPLAGFTGPVIAYAPDLPTLAAAEQLPITCAVLALAAENIPLSPWVDAFTPRHLAGHVLTPLQPLLPDATVRRAMVYFTHRLVATSPANEPSTLHGIVAGIRHLQGQGCVFTTEELLALALQLNWSPSAIGRLQHMLTDAFPAPAAWPTQPSSPRPPSNP
ncbi:hypothetical protein, partial [Kocuria sp. SM24M-10]